MNIYIVVIYDISNNKKRNKLAKEMRGYGYRVQRSSFECNLDVNAFKRLKRALKKYEGEGDSIRIYRIIGNSNIIAYDSNKKMVENDDLYI